MVEQADLLAIALTSGNKGEYDKSPAAARNLAAGLDQSPNFNQERV
jgi:hypothetical protein